MTTDADKIRFLAELAGWELTRCPAALDALEVEGRDIQFHMFDLQTRLDAATELIRQAMATVHILHFVRQPDSWHDLAKPDIDACPDCAPYRAWLAGDKGAGNE